MLYQYLIYFYINCYKKSLRISNLDWAFSWKKIADVSRKNVIKRSISDLKLLRQKVEM